MYNKIPLGSRVRIISTIWGKNSCNPGAICENVLLGKIGTVVSYWNDFFSPPNVVKIEGIEYCFNDENLEIIGTTNLNCTCGAKFTSFPHQHSSWC